MDANFKRRRDRCFSQRREERWSMDSQRFEAILAEIRNGYNNIRKSFDKVKIADILEEVMTEYAAEALRAERAPPFTELAVLLQHCSELYARKVDCLHRDVLEWARADDAATEHAASAEHAEHAAPRRRRAAPAALADFAHIEVATHAAAARAEAAPRAPPTLPRAYVALEPRVPPPHRLPLRDYEGAPLGLPADYYLCARLGRGRLLERLAPAAPAPAPAPRPLSLLELQAALLPLAASTPLRPPARCSLDVDAGIEADLSADSALGADASDTAATDASDVTAPASAADSGVSCDSEATARRRKRRAPADAEPAPVAARVPRLRVGAALAAWAAHARDFSPCAAWLRRAVTARARALLAARRAARAAAAQGPFAGWSEREAAAAAACAARHFDSDADDYCDRFSSGGAVSPPADQGAEAEAAAARAMADAAWSAGVAARAAAGSARGLDARALVARVRAAVAAAAPLSARALLRLAARPADVSRLLLAALILASAGDVRLERGAPLALHAFTLHPAAPAAPAAAAPLDLDCGL